MKKPKVPQFATEADLCTAFIAAVEARRKWRCYPETCGFDILLVNVNDGRQIGVEAKLRLNNKVVAQALPDYFYGYAMEGPHYRAVLVPWSDVENDLQPICDALGVTVIRYAGETPYRRQRWFEPQLPDDDSIWQGQWHEWAPVRSCRLPEHVPDVRAGASAPIQLTDWKIKAIKMSVLLEERPVTRADFKALALDPRRWTDHWLTSTPSGYVRSENFPDFLGQHPEVSAKIRAERSRWAPKGLFEATPTP